MNKKILSKIEKLKTDRAKLDVRIQAEESRAKQSNRKKETRRKILVGSYFLDQATQTNQMDDIKQKMGVYLKRNSDRALFDLPRLEAIDIEKDSGSKTLSTSTEASRESA